MGSKEVNGQTAKLNFKHNETATSPNDIYSWDAFGQCRKRLGRNTLRGPEQRQRNTAFHELDHSRHKHSGCR
jgi:hypothetical protein